MFTFSDANHSVISSAVFRLSPIAGTSPEPSAVDPWERGFDVDSEPAGNGEEAEPGEDTDEGEPAVAAERGESSRRRFRRR